MSFFPYYSVLTLLISLMAFASGFFVLSRNSKSALNQTYFAFCMEIVLWLFPTSVTTSKLLSPDTTVMLAKIVYVGVAFMPTTALHFSIIYLGSDAFTRARVHLRFAYAITIIFVVLLFTTNQFITGYYDYSWGYYPKTGIIHYFHVFFVLITASYIMNMLWVAMRRVQASAGKIKKYYEYKFLFLSFCFATFSSTDFLHNWGVDFFPVGCIFMALFVASTTYAIFKHSLLGISIVVQKSLIYSLLISIVVSLYFSTVYLLSSFVGNLTAAHSPLAIVAILAVITILFNPIEQRIQNSIGRLFFKQSRDVLEKENLLLRQEIQKQDRLKSIATLAAGMAHEIKNPLTSIKTFAEYLPQKYDDADFREKFSKIVTGEVDRINNIVRQLLEFSKPAEPEIKAVSLIPILEETLSLMNGDFLAHRIGIARDLDTCPDVLADKNQLKQVFLNLFLNSIQSMKDGGRLSVSSRFQPNGHVRISISDTGCGIPKEQLTHLFDPFYTTREEGTGLGLAIVHSIIKKHGGKIEVESEVGRGTTISVILKSRD